MTPGLWVSRFRSFICKSNATASSQLTCPKFAGYIRNVSSLGATH